jgi:Predicted membrane protein (DUF2207)
VIGGSGTTLGFVAFVDRPSTSLLVVAAVCAVVGWIARQYAVQVSRPARAKPVGSERPAPDGEGRMEPPAVVGLLTNGYHVPKSAVTATVLDLAARGWIRLTTTEGEVVVVLDGRGQVGDALRPFEQLVLGHLAANAFDGVTSAGTLAATQRRLDRRWWARFRREVVRSARNHGLTHRRFAADVLGPPAVASAVGGLFAWWAVASGEVGVAMKDDVAVRVTWAVAVIALAALAWSVVRLSRSASELPTEAGAARADLWLGYRSRLRARVPERAGVVSSPEQQLALARAVVMGVAEHVIDQLPVVAEDDRRAWSEAGGVPHVVRVRYPMRPGFGGHPSVVAGLGVAVLFGGVWARGFFQRVADGEALQGLVEDFPDQQDLIETVARVLSVVVLVPIAWSVWALLAGIVDLVWTRERTGAIVRVRRPLDVVRFRRLLRPLADRDRYAVYMAVDDGRHRSVTACLANERTAAPQGATARVRSTPMLGYVRSSEPVGTSTRVLRP